MKKFFTLLATALVALSANAQIAWQCTPGSSYAMGDKLVDNEYATATVTLTSGDANSFGEETPTKTIGGETFSAYLKVRVTDAPAAANNWEGTVGDGVAVKVVAKKNTDLVIYARYGSTKSITLVDATDQASVAPTIESSDADGDNILVKAVAKLQAAHTYVLCMRGGTMGLCGLNTLAGTFVEASNSLYANTGASVVDGYSTMTYKDGAKVALVGNDTKAYSNGSAITIDGASYTTTKVSNGAQNKFICPDGKLATKVVIWSYVNKDAKTERPCFWKEVNNVAYSLDGAEGSIITTEMGSYKDMTNPDNYTFELGGVSEFTFTNTGEQACFVLDVTYGAADGISTVTTNAAAKTTKCIENGQLVIKTAKGNFNAAGAHLK